MMTAGPQLRRPAAARFKLWTIRKISKVAERPLTALLRWLGQAAVEQLQDRGQPIEEQPARPFAGYSELYQIELFEESLAAFRQELTPEQQAELNACLCFLQQEIHFARGNMAMFASLTQAYDPEESFRRMIANAVYFGIRTERYRQAVKDWGIQLIQPPARPND